MSQTQQQCFAAGMDAVIVKPFDPTQFYETVEKTALQTASVIT